METLLDTRQLRAFHLLAQMGSFTRAAESLHLTQSAVSHSIRALESDLGCQLFFRQGKKAHLTAQGRELLSHCEAIFSRMGQIRSSLGALDQSPKGKLRIGTTASAAQFILPLVLREFMESFPLYAISIYPGETPDTLRLLQKAEIDLAVCLKPNDTSGLKCQMLFQDELQLLVSPLHRWVKTKPKASELGQETFIISSRQSYTYQLISSYFAKQSTRLGSLIELGSSEAMKELVKLGLGVSLMADWAARQEVASGQLAVVPLPKGRIKREWVVAYAKDRPLTLAERTFVGLCVEAQSELLPTERP